MKRKCDDCNCELVGLIPLIKTTEDFDGSQVYPEQVKKWLCKSCIDRSFEYAFCWCCGEELAYHVTQLNTAGECSEHEGESSMDSATRDGWNDIIDNLS